jgi:hypothetical protein
MNNTSKDVLKVFATKDRLNFGTLYASSKLCSLQEGGDFKARWTQRDCLSDLDDDAASCEDSSASRRMTTAICTSSSAYITASKAPT